MRRYHKRILLAVALGLLTALTVAAPGLAGSVEIQVLNPAGVVPVSQDLAARPNSLNGKTIAFWLSSDDPLYGFGGAVLDGVRSVLLQAYPQARVIPYTELPMTYKPEEEVAQRIVALQPDAVIGGVGG